MTCIRLVMCEHYSTYKSQQNPSKLV